MRPRARRPPGQGINAQNDPYPTLVAEVGLSESVGSLHVLAVEYFDPRTTNRCYLAVKIWPERSDGTFAALALLYLRTNSPSKIPAQAISFGTAPIHLSAVDTMPNMMSSMITGNHGDVPEVCKAAGIPAFSINIPVAELYHEHAIRSVCDSTGCLCMIF
jgi:hypothetical protein